jgi:hypothetical protein
MRTSKNPSTSGHIVTMATFARMMVKAKLFWAPGYSTVYPKVLAKLQYKVLLFMRFNHIKLLVTLKSKI